MNTNWINDFIKMEEHPHVSGGTFNKPKSVSKSNYHTLIIIIIHNIIITIIITLVYVLFAPLKFSGLVGIAI